MLYTLYCIVSYLSQGRLKDIMNTCLYNMLCMLYEDVKEVRMQDDRHIDDGILEVFAVMEAHALQDMYDMAEDHITTTAIPLMYFDKVSLISITLQPLHFSLCALCCKSLRRRRSCPSASRATSPISASLPRLSSSTRPSGR